jgi:CO/xanthine dehydrogenase FAD-binding subunit
MLVEPGLDNRPLGGGTDLLVSLRYQGPQPSLRLVDISRLRELKEVRQQGKRVTAGAGLTFREIIDNELLHAAVPFLISTCSQIGGPQVRNTGTLGGNIVNAAVCADTLPVLVCLGAEVELRSTKRVRSMPVADFVLGPQQTCLEPGELLTSVSFDLPPEGTHTLFIKLGRRNAQTISRLTLAAMAHLSEDGCVDLVHIVPGAATQRVERYPQAEGLLLGLPPSRERIAGCGATLARLALGENGRRWSAEYKEAVIARLANRALSQLLLVASPEDVQEGSC